MKDSKLRRRIAAGSFLGLLIWVAAGRIAWTPLEAGERARSASVGGRSKSPEADSPTVDARFRLAARLKREPDASARERALATYRSLLQDERDHPRAGEAAFRIGEMARTDGRFDAACRAFAEAEALDSSTVFAWRARLERAHIARRTGHAEDALHLYAEVFGDVRCKTRYRDEAAFWAGRTQVERGRPIDARAWFRWVCEHAEDPARRVRAYDEWMLGFVSEGDLEGAAGVLAQLRVRLAEHLHESTDVGVRTRRAFANMRAPKKLEVAVRTRHRTR